MSGDPPYNGTVNAAGSVRVCVLATGSAANSVLLEAGRTRLLVDAGLSAEATVRRLQSARVEAGSLGAILLTHEHDDHARGAGAVARLCGAPVLANEKTLRACAFLSGAFHDRIDNARAFRIGEWTVEAVPVAHDAADPVGFVLSAYGVRVAIATDLGTVEDVFVERAAGADVVLLEANYDLRLMGVSPYPWFVRNRILSRQGHLSNDAAARAAVRLHTGSPQRVVLVHLSEVNNLAPLARDTVAEALCREGIRSVTVETVRPGDTADLTVVTGR
ncbi:MAG: MBL fold metallo-hydrolase [Armatimonadota bacterium]|nr:MBL fold metallo-hydrolase [Armatimonadota bacterium]